MLDEVFPKSTVTMETIQLFFNLKPYKPSPAQALPLCENGLSLVQKPQRSFISLCDIRVLRERIIAISRNYYIENFYWLKTISCRVDK